jgi:hypothetical protein
MATGREGYLVIRNVVVAAVLDELAERLTR